MPIRPLALSTGSEGEVRLARGVSLATGVTPITKTAPAQSITPVANTSIAQGINHIISDALAQNIPNIMNTALVPGAAHVTDTTLTTVLTLAPATDPSLSTTPVIGNQKAKGNAHRA